MENVSKSKSLKVLTAATGINFIAGLLYIWSVISKSLVNELHWTSKQASLPYTISTVSFVIAMVVFGKIQDAKGPRVTATIGGILLGTGLILSGLTTSPIMMILTLGIIAGAGIGIINVSTTPPALKWFAPEKKGMITGIVVAGVGLSSIFYSPLANFLMKEVGISKTFIYIGIGALIASVILAQFLQNPPKDYVPEGKDKSTNQKKNSANSSRDFSSNEMLKSKNFYKLWIMLAFSSSAGLMIIGHISNIAKVQVNWEGGFLLVIFLAIFNTLGRIIGGTLSDKIGRVNLMRGIFILQGLNMFLFAKYNNIALIAFGAAVAGLCYGAGFSVFPATVSDLYGTKYFGANYGLMFTSWGLGGIIGPMTGAFILDSTGNYNTAYLVAFGLLVISTIVTFTFKTSTKDVQYQRS